MMVKCIKCNREFIKGDFRLCDITGLCYESPNEPHAISHYANSRNKVKDGRDLHLNNSKRKSKALDF